MSIERANNGLSLKIARDESALDGGGKRIGKLFWFLLDGVRRVRKQFALWKPPRYVYKRRKKDANDGNFNLIETPYPQDSELEALDRLELGPFRANPKQLEARTRVAHWCLQVRCAKATSASA